MKCLEFYGDKSNWNTAEADHYRESIKLKDCAYLDVNKIYTDAIRYGGKRARACLKDIKDKHGNPSK